VHHNYPGGICQSKTFDFNRITADKGFGGVDKNNETRSNNADLDPIIRQRSDITMKIAGINSITKHEYSPIAVNVVSSKFAEKQETKLAFNSGALFTVTARGVNQLQNRTRKSRAPARRIRKLIKKLDDSNVKVTMKAAWRLGTLKARSAVPALLAEFKNPRNATELQNVKVIAWALGNIKYKKSVHTLITIFNRARTGIFRSIVALSLGMICDTRAVPALSREGKYGGQLGVWGRYHVALGMIKDKRAAPIIISQFKTQRKLPFGNHWAQTAGLMAWALGEMKERSAIAVLTKARKSRSKIISREAKFALCKIKGLPCAKLTKKLKGRPRQAVIDYLLRPLKSPSKRQRP
jgi:HEAT repeat protein